MNDIAQFRIVGAITQKYVSPSGKYAGLKVETKINGFKSIHNLKSFDATVVRQISTCGIGEMVQVDGDIGTEVLKNKAKDAIEVDGYKVYQETLKITSIAPANTNAAAQVKKADPFEDDEIPF